MSHQILLVDDSASDAQWAQAAVHGSLEHIFELTYVAALEAALEQARVRSFDVIVTSLSLPGYDGIDAARALLRAVPYCPLVVLTSSGSEQLEVEALHEGADDYLIKGECTPAAFLRALRHAMERRRAMQRAEAALEDETRIIQTLQRIGSSLTAELDLQRVVQLVTDEATALTRAAFGAFFYNVTRATGDSYMLYTLSGVSRDAFASFPMPRNTPLFAMTFQGEGVVRSDDIVQDSRYGQMTPHRGMPQGHLPVRSYLAVPVISRSKSVIGGLFFGHPEQACFGEREEQIAVGIAAWAAVAVDNARLYAAERRARGDAERANLVKAEFLTNMSHELRTPLNAMIGYTDLWLLGLPAPLPEVTQPQIHRVRRSAQHLLSLIEEILTFSRLEAGHERMEPESVSLQDQLQMVATVIAPLALEKRLGFHTDIPRRPITMVTDARKLRQILINLLSNAVKFTAAGEIRLSVEERGAEVVFTVTDTGRGIPRPEQEHIFEPFRQSSGFEGRPEGTGLGLTVSRRLARLLGGDVSVSSLSGQGSTFVVQLPVESVADPVIAH